MHIRDGFSWNEVCALHLILHSPSQVALSCEKTTANVVKSNNNGPLGISPAQLTFFRTEQDGSLGVCDAETGLLVDGGETKVFGWSCV